MLSLASVFTFAQDKSYTFKNNTFTSVKPSKSNNYKQTPYTYDLMGKSYPIYISNTGRCFIFKVSSKTNKEYKYYLKKDISKEICKLMNIKYKDK